MTDTSAPVTTLTFTQYTASEVWTIAHNQGTSNLIILYFGVDDSGNYFETKPLNTQLLDINTVQATFIAPIAGIAQLTLVNNEVPLVALQPTPTPSFTPSPSVTPTGTAAPSPTPTPTLTATMSATITPTPTATLSSTPTMTPTPSFTPSATITPTPTITLTPTMSLTPSPVHKIKWNPGFYLGGTGYQYTASTVDRQKELDALFSIRVNNPFKGYRILLPWEVAEPTQGAYHWRQPGNALDQYIAQLAANGKKIIVSIPAVGFDTFATNGINSWWPPYISTDINTYGPSPIASFSGYWGNYINGISGQGQCAALWRPNVMKAYMACAVDFCRHYNDNPAVEALLFPDVASYVQMATAYTIDPTYSNSAFAAQLQALLTACVQAAPNMSIAIQNTTLLAAGSGITDTQKFEEWLITGRVLPADAHTYGASYLSTGILPNPGMAAYMGQTFSGSSYNGPDFSTHATHAMMEINAQDFGAYGGVNKSQGYSAQDIITALNNNYKASHAIFDYNVIAPPQTSGLFTNLVPILQASSLTNINYPGSYP